VPGHESLLGYISELGYFSVSAFGAITLSFSDIFYWSRLTKINLVWWEVNALRKMSAAYIDQAEKAKEHLCAPPWQAETLATPEVREQVIGFFKEFVANRKSRENTMIPQGNVVR
jgi:hypothetical protein